MTGNNWNLGPGAEEVEVSVFGPGFGECILMHLGHGDWIVVDSCLDPSTRSPIALKYLNAIGTQGSSIALVVSTHWHDDHQQGLAKMFASATASRFACTAIINQPVFAEILGAWTGTRFLSGGSGIDELRSILEEMRRRATHRSNYHCPCLASANKLLWERPDPPTRVRALSPSDAAQIAAIGELATIAPNPGGPRRRLPQVGSNDGSVVISVEIGADKVLLGADLENRRTPSLGWGAVVSDYVPAGGRYAGFKIPHHGSETSHHAEVWDKLLAANVWSVTTPFVRGRVELPTDADRCRILGLCRRSFLTAPARRRKYSDSDKAVEKMVTESTLSASLSPGAFGHVRFRKAIHQPEAWQVELFGDAIDMANSVLSRSEFLRPDA